jgi:hypothetical protein
MVENDPLIISRKAKATIVATTGASVSPQLVRGVLKSLRCSRKGCIIVQAAPVSTDIGTTAFLERHDEYDAQGRRFVFFRSMRLASRDGVGAYLGIRG